MPTLPDLSSVDTAALAAKATPQEVALVDGYLEAEMNGDSEAQKQILSQMFNTPQK